MVKLRSLSQPTVEGSSSTKGILKGDDDTNSGTPELHDSMRARYGRTRSSPLHPNSEPGSSLNTFTVGDSGEFGRGESMKHFELSLQSEREKTDRACDSVGSTILMSSQQLEKIAKVDDISSHWFKSDGLKLHGREGEIQSLKACLDRVNSKDGSRELVLIHGASGNGKTALAKQLFIPVRQLNGTFALGKFDLYQRDGPYAALTAACRKIVGKILHLKATKADNYEALIAALELEIGEELSILEKVVPELSEIVVAPGSADAVGENEESIELVDVGENEQAKAKLHYAFRSLIRVMSEHLAPLVIVLDDMQWSDPASLDLVGSLMTDRKSHRLLIVGLYRSDEVDQAHLLSKLLNDLDHKAEDVCLTITKMPVEELSLEDVNHILMDLFSIDEEKTTIELAELCHRRTLGNSFFLISYVHLLTNLKLVTFNFGSYKWMWDISEIMAKTAATTNVVEVTRAKMEFLHASVGTHLAIAACLGHTFELSTLGTVWAHLKKSKNGTRVDASGDNCEDAEESVDDPNQWLHQAEEYGFIERQDEMGSIYKWIHDQIQESSLSLVPEGELATLKGRIGGILWKELDEDIVSSMFFVIVNLLNDAPRPDNAWDRMGLAKLNLQAASRSADICAFDSAAKYSERGIDVLPTDAWSRDYDLALDLYSTSAEAENSLGRSDLVEERFNEVVSQKDHPLSGKLRVIRVMCHKLVSEIRHDEAVVLIIEALSGMGVTFPKGKLSRVFTMLSDTRKVKKQLKRYRAPEDILSLPKMRRATNKHIMTLLFVLAGSCYRSKKHKILMPLAILESAKLTLADGISEFSAPSFAALGLMFVGILNDTLLGSKMGSMAMQIIDNFDCRSTESRTLAIVTCLCNCWVEPIAGLAVPLLRGYNVGMSTGETEYAMMVSQTCGSLPERTFSTHAVLFCCCIVVHMADNCCRISNWQAVEATQFRQPYIRQANERNPSRQRKISNYSVLGGNQNASWRG